MPELPEVETIKRGLSNFCLEQKIKKVEVRCEKSFIGPSEIVEGKKIEGFRRFGKALVVDLSGGLSLLIHLRMTGQLIYRDFSYYEEKSRRKESSLVTKSKSEVSDFAAEYEILSKSSFAGGHPTDAFYDELPNKQTRVIFELGDGVLYFNDQRKFGFVKVLPTVEILQDSFIKKLAKEPWEMSADEFYEKLKRHKSAPIKAVILDQKVICGLGNIYADEALYAAKIHPRTLAGSLNIDAAKRLLESAKKVMEASINSGGSTMKTYVKADGTKGDYLERFAKVFRREGLPCERCGMDIEKIRVAGRGTHICPGCQKFDMEDVGMAGGRKGKDD